MRRARPRGTPPRPAGRRARPGGARPTPTRGPTAPRRTACGRGTPAAQRRDRGYRASPTLAVEPQRLVHLEDARAQRPAFACLGVGGIDVVDVESITPRGFQIIDDGVQRVRALTLGHEPVHVVALLGDGRAVTCPAGAVDGGDR